MSGADFLRLGGYFLEFAASVVVPVFFLTWATWRAAR